MESRSLVYSNDGNIQGTNEDAAASRMSAVRAGYFEDSYLPLLAKRLNHASKRPPLINRGTFIRFTAINYVFDKFLTKYGGSRCQILSLGAGSDTRVFDLKSKGRLQNVTYYEMDFTTVVTPKMMSIKNHKKLHNLVGEFSLENGGAVLKAADSSYVLFGADLREWDTKVVPLLLEKLEFNPAIPTLILLEVVMVYLPDEVGTNILEWFSRCCKEAVLCTFDPFNAVDSFGKMMLTNLRSRGVDMPGILPCSDLDSIKSRQSKLGYSRTECLTMNDLWEKWISEKERERVEQLEFLDELEEMTLLFNHYCLTLAYLGSCDLK